MLGPRRQTHIEHQVLQTRRLCCWPVNTRSRTRTGNSCHIEDKVPDLSVKYVRRYPVQVCRIVLITVNEPESGKVRGGLDGGYVRWVANEHREVLVEY